MQIRLWAMPYKHAWDENNVPEIQIEIVPQCLISYEDKKRKK